MKNSVKASLFLSSLGLILASISAQGQTASVQISDPQNVAAAELLAEMIQKGLISVDSTGAMKINGSIFSILKQYDAIKEVELPASLSSCSHTMGGCFL